MDGPLKPRPVRFVLRMAARELRSSARSFVLFFAAVGIGVSAIVVLRSMSDRLQEALSTEARTIMAADVAVSTSDGFDEETEAIFEAAAAGYGVTGTARTARIATLARAGAASDRGVTVELKGVDAGFPLYGEIELEGDVWRPEILEDRGAVVRPELLARLDIEVGDPIRLGGSEFEVRGLVLEEPGAGLSFFQRGPRVFVALDDLRSTGLLDVPSRGSRQALFAVEAGDGGRQFATDLREALNGRPLSVRTFLDTGDSLARRVRRAEEYLSLAGFVILVLGGVGVFTATRTFVQRSLHSAAIERCLGVSARSIFGIALVQVGVLGAIASGFGVGVAAIALGTAVPTIEIGTVEVVPGLGGTAVIEGVIVGVLVALLASLFPMLPLARVRPLGLLRGDGELLDEQGGLRARRGEMVAAALVAGAFFALAGWQSGSLQTTLIVTGGLVAVAIALWFLGGLFLRLLAPFASSRRFAVAHAVRTVMRGARPIRVVLAALGVGIFLVLAVTGIERNLTREFAFQENSDDPDIFFLDIQSDQADAIRENALANGAPAMRLIPVVQARIHGVSGRTLDLPDRAAIRQRGGLGREYTVSSRDHLEDNEEVVAGEFWGDRPANGIEVSAEIELQRDHGLAVGDMVRFRILGETLEARVTSIRNVDWRNARNGGFTFLFHPDNLRDFPMSYAGFARGPDGMLDRARFVAAVAGDYPNVTVVDFRDVLDTMQRVADSVSLAIRAVGVIAVIGGLLILIGSVAVHMGARRRETAVLRVVGAGRRRILAVTLLEHGALGGIAGAAAVAGAGATTWLIVNQVMQLPFSSSPWLGAAGIVLPVLGACVVGAFAAADVLRRKPLRVLSG